METEEGRSGYPSTTMVEQQVCCDGHEGQANTRSGMVVIHSHHHTQLQQQQQQRLSDSNHHVRSSTVRNIEIDWREVDPYFSELSDCASFWTLINFTCDVIYSGLFVLFFIMGQDVESMFFEGLLNHINPILIYLILSLIINYGALRSLRSGREKCFLVFSVMKGLLFPITISLLVYLVFCDVQEYFGTFWVSFVVIVSCYNGTAALGLWSMFTCNKYILVNEAAQKRMRKQAKQQRSMLSEESCSCRLPTVGNSENNQILATSSSRVYVSPNLRRIGDSSLTNNFSLTCKFDGIGATSSTSIRCKNQISSKNGSHSPVVSGPSRVTIAKDKPRMISDDEDDDFHDLPYGDEEEVLQISTVHKVMQEITLVDSRTNSNNCDRDTVSDV